MTDPTTAEATLSRSSVDVILAGQSDSGAYIASPNFPEYRFGWLRDGAYCAMAMSAVGEQESALRFHRWVGRVIESQAPRIQEIVSRLRDGSEVDTRRMLPTRYRLDGTPEPEAPEAWPNFQLDGYGTWVFSLHREFGADAPEEFREAVRLAADYLQAAWELPCYDYWEESGDRRHTSTLAAIAAGLRAAGEILGRADLGETAAQVVGFIVDACVRDGSFVKGPADARVDASLLSLALPFGLVPLRSAVMSATVERIRAELASPSGGIRRYVGDEYYGGNPWFLLTAWLGWYDRLVGDEDGYRRAKGWVELRASPDGDLAEQTIEEPQNPETVDEWIERWGPVADPLLWSHAKYLLMERGGEPTSWS